MKWSRHSEVGPYCSMKMPSMPTRYRRGGPEHRRPRGELRVRIVFCLRGPAARSPEAGAL